MSPLQALAFAASLTRSETSNELHLRVMLLVIGLIDTSRIDPEKHLVRCSMEVPQSAFQVGSDENDLPVHANRPGHRGIILCIGKGFVGRVVTQGLQEMLAENAPTWSIKIRISQRAEFKGVY